MAFIKVTIGGVDVTSKVLYTATLIESKLGRQMDTAHLDIFDSDGLTSIAERDEVIISNPAETFRYFGGYVANIRVDSDLEEAGGQHRVYRLDCQDFTSKVDSRRIVGTFENKTDKYIIGDIFGTYLPEFNANTYVDTGNTLAYVIFSLKSIREMLNELCSASGKEWNIDYWKNLRYFDAGTAVAASFGLSDTPDYVTTFPYQILDYSNDVTQIRNKVYIKGGSRIDEADTYYLGKAGATPPDIDIGCDGIKKVFIVPYKFLPSSDEFSHFWMWVNFGGEPPTDDFQAVLVGTEGVDGLLPDDGLYWVLWNYEDMRLTFWQAPLELYKSIKIEARRYIPVETTMQEDTSIGPPYNFGLWEEVISDPKIISEDVATLTGEVFLAQNAFPRLTLRVRCWRDGLEVGQKISATEVLRGISGNFVIKEMKITFPNLESAEYELSLDTYRPDTVDILLKLQDMITSRGTNKLSELEIDISKDWLNFNIINLGSLYARRVIIGSEEDCRLKLPVGINMYDED